MTLISCQHILLFFPQNSNNPVYRRIYQHMERKKSYVASMDEGVRRTQEGNFAFIGEAVSLDLAVARYCKLTRSQEVIAMRAYSIAAPVGEFFCHTFFIAASCFKGNLVYKQALCFLVPVLSQHHVTASTRRLWNQSMRP